MKSGIEWGSLTSCSVHAVDPGFSRCDGGGVDRDQTSRFPVAQKVGEGDDVEVVPRPQVAQYDIHGFLQAHRSRMYDMLM